nr:retroviral-like aspartic protease family protein [Seonamhaeicola sediminis]
MEKLNGVYQIPCKVNGIPMKFIFDTGASDVSISYIEAGFLLKQGLLKEDDVLGSVNYKMANGEIREGTKINLKSIDIGGTLLSDINATIVHNLEAPLLLGQTAIDKLGAYTIKENLLIFNDNNEELSLEENDKGYSRLMNFLVKENLIEFVPTSELKDNHDIKNLVKKLDSLTTLKNKDNPITQYELGASYMKLYHEIVQVIDKSKAKEVFYKSVYLLEQACNNKSEDACYELGENYRFAVVENGTIDSKKSIYWYKKGANLGNSLTSSACSHSLGRYYKNSGKDDEAFYWFHKAAVAGQNDSYSELGDCYYYGEGVSKDYEKALYWYEKGVLPNYKKMGDIFYYGGYGITMDFGKAVEYYEKGAANRYYGSNTMLGQMYYLGEHFKVDKRKAFLHYEIDAKKNGHDHAYYMMGLMTYNGEGILTDRKKGFKYYYEAAYRGHSAAQYQVGVSYYYGYGTNIDKAKSASWIEKSFENGYERAKEFWDNKQLWIYKED